MKFWKMIVEISDKNLFSYFLYLEFISKMTRPNPTLPEQDRLGLTLPWQFLTVYFLESVKVKNVKLWDNFDASIKIELSKLWTDIFGSLKLYAFQHSRNFCNCLIITFEWKRNFKFWWFHRKRSDFDLIDLTLYFI